MKYIFITLIILAKLSVLDAEDSRPSFYYCSQNLEPDSLIGKAVKVFTEQVWLEKIEQKRFTHYPDSLIDLVNNTDWGDSYLQTGDIGHIVHVEKGHSKYEVNYSIEYIVNFDGKYAKLRCTSLIDTSEYDAIELNALYAQGCEFKTRSGIGMYHREGAFPIDVLAETFACDLQSSGIDTLMLIKHFLNEDDEQFVLWIDSGAMYMKSFGIDENGACENDVVLYDWSKILTYYFEDEVYLEHELPRSAVRGGMIGGLSVQFRCGKDHFYNQTLKPQYFDLVDPEKVSNHLSKERVK